MSGPDTYLGRDYGSHAEQTRELEEVRGYREPDERAVDFEQDLQDDLAAERLGITPKLGLPDSHQRGEAAVTTVEARGCPSPAPERRERHPDAVAGRAAGALLTGQRQDGPSCDPACARYPVVAHGDDGALKNPGLRKRAA